VQHSYRVNLLDSTSQRHEEALVQPFVLEAVWRADAVPELAEIFVDDEVAVAVRRIGLYSCLQSLSPSTGTPITASP